ncbi:MAG: SafA/ExsA family spore coat assembly protein [Clostridia bacterium]|nr:SafA/ExsA family spore coat assembly protein [Clostridia bacterium]
MLCFAPTQAYASDTVHTVVKGDTMWKIAVKYQVGTSEIVKANPQIPDPNLIYPGQKLNIPGKDGTVTAYEAEVVRLVNSYRAQYGLSPLSENWELSRVARFKSQDMCDRKYFSHTSPTYGSPFDMIKAFGLGYRTAGENIARGQTSPQEVVHAWMNSSGHRANILNSSFRYIGVGYVASGNYWTQMFTG